MTTPMTGAAEYRGAPAPAYTNGEEARSLASRDARRLRAERTVNQNYKELKVRIRTLEELLSARGTGNMQFAQALSAVRRAEKHGDRTRDPSAPLRALLEKAELLGRLLTGQAT